MKKVTKNYKMIFNKKGVFVGFMSGNDDDDINAKAKEMKLRVYGMMFASGSWGKKNEQ